MSNTFSTTKPAKPLALLTSVALGAGLALAPAQAAAPTSVDRAPSAVIAGPATLLDATHWDIATDATGRTISLLEGAVLVFAKGASGNAAPERVITFTSPADQFVQAVTVDADGWIYVLTTDYGSPAQSTILSFQPGASGAAGYLSVTGAALNLDSPIDITDRGGLVAVLDAGEHDVSTFSLRTGSTTQVGGLASGLGSQTGIVFAHTINSDAAGRLILTGENPGTAWVSVFGADADGDVVPEQYLAGPETGLEETFSYAALGPTNDLLVSTKKKVLRFAPSATGNVAPETTLAGASTGLGNTVVMDVAPDGRIVTSNLDVNTFTLGPLRIFTDIGPYAAPAKVGRLKAKGKAKDAKRKISWKAAATHADTPVTGYRVKVTCKPKGKGKKQTKLNKTLSGNARGTKVKLGSFHKGVCKATVKAENTVGTSRTATKKFTVKRTKKK